LQSTVMGEHPLACINGQFIKPGQAVDGFALERILPDRVLLNREGVQVVLLLK